MAKNNLLNGMKAIDGHLHIHRLKNDKGELFINGYDEYRALYDLTSVNIAALPRDISNTMAIAFYKLIDPTVFAHGCLHYVNCENADPVSQYEELMDIGFDGIKMLEGKPEMYKRVNIPLDSDYYRDFFKRAESDGTHILMHIADPESFWDAEKTSEEHKAKGWFYGDGTYPTSEELYRQIDALLENNPELNLTLAHFYFCSEKPEKLSKMLDTYKNLAVDITPGGEMYEGFNKNPEYFHDFFVKYNKQILLGTDGDFPCYMKAMEWLIDRIYRFLSTDETIKSFNDVMIKGIKIPMDCVENIFYNNYVRRVSCEPRPINKAALKSYIEKYKRFIPSKENYEIIEELSKKYL